MKSTLKTAFFITTYLLSLASSAGLAEADDLKLTKSGANFMTGGIGREEVEAMRRVAKQYPLQILLSEGKHGTALTDVSVAITDAAGATVFSIQKAGPLLYVKLPAGDYKVSGNYNGLKQAQKITLLPDGKTQKIYLNWVGQPGDEIPEE